MTLQRLVRFVFLAALSFATAQARADELTPELETQSLRARVDGELKKLFATLSPADQKRLSGLYVAFDPTGTELLAQVACDDDGDYVILVSDAMLRLASHVARAQSYDEANGSRKIEDYASYVARSQVPGRRILPPQAGFYIAMKPASSYDERLRDVLSFLLSRELAHFRAGDLVCAHPTATKESGDDEWTAAEQKQAANVAANVYPGRTFERDFEGATRLLDAGRKEDGALAFLRFFTQLELEQRVVVSRFVPAYETQHPGAAARAAAVHKAVEAHAQN